MCVSVQPLCSADAATSRKHQPKEKGISVQSRYVKGTEVEFLFLHQEVSLFRHAPISLPVRGPPEDCYFCSYSILCLFHFLFYCFCFVLFCFSYLIPSDVNFEPLKSKRLT